MCWSLVRRKQPQRRHQARPEAALQYAFGPRGRIGALQLAPAPRVGVLADALAPVPLGFSKRRFCRGDLSVESGSDAFSECRILVNRSGLPCGAWARELQACVAIYRAASPFSLARLRMPGA